MANVNATDSVIRQIMEGVDPRTAIDSVLDEKSGYHKERRIRDGHAEVVNVKNKKRKVHHTLTPDQKKAIKKAHSATANKKRAKSLKKGNKMGLYKEGIEMTNEAEEEVVAGIGIACPACGGALEIFADPEAESTDVVLVCPDCGETYVLCNTSEIEDEESEDNEDDDKDEKDDADKEEGAEDAGDAEAAEEEVPQDEAKECDGTGCNGTECDGNECDDQACDGACEPEEESGLFFAAE